jgi:hypothetical protein
MTVHLAAPPDLAHDSTELEPRVDDRLAELHQDAPPASHDTAAEPAGEALAPEPNIGRSGLIGAVIGFIVVTLAVTIGGTLGGIHPDAALGIGIAAGMWGGAGFGFMMGATVPFSRYLDALHVVPTTGDRGPDFAADPTDGRSESSMH